MQIDRGLLGLYLADHLSGATAGVERVERMAQSYQDLPVHADLVLLRDELRQEHQRLQQIIERLGTHRRPLRQAAGWVGEKLGRLKLNRRLVRRSPYSVVLELELLRGAVMAKQGLWQSLHDLAGPLGLDAEELDRLTEAATVQRERLERMHATVRTDAFGR